jgi:hypothetical protein
VLLRSRNEMYVLHLFPFKVSHSPNHPPSHFNLRTLFLSIYIHADKPKHQIKTEVLRICGIALSNSQFTPVTFCAGIAVAMCGERFVKREEQEPLMRILEQAEGHVAWRSLRASERMKDVWGWS